MAYSPDERGFDAFVADHARRLTQVLVAGYGLDVGQEAADEAFVVVWQRWKRVAAMEKPFGYCITVGRNVARRLAGRERAVFPAAVAGHEARVEPGLGDALAALPARRREVVLLVHGFGWSMGEAAAALGISKSSVQTHCDRALSSIRDALGVTA